MQPRVTLTFDNGPTPGVTERVLDALAERDVHATFFVVGRDLQRPGARELARRAVAEGHWIGNHTMTHELQFGEAADPDRPRREIVEAQGVIGDLATPDRLFRPYGGGGLIGPKLLTAGAVQTLTQGAYTCVLWNCVPRDWEQPDAWVQTCLDQIERRRWSLVVLHDTDTGAMRRLPALLDELAARGTQLRQDFPADCVPIRRGQLVGPVEQLLPAPCA